MDINEYAMEYLVRERLSTLRAPAASAPSARVWLGDAFIRAGQWLRAGAAEPAPSQPTRG